MRKLSGKQTAFIEHYVGDCRFNATEAAAKAGYKGNRNVLRVIGTENLTKLALVSEIDKRKVELREQTGITVGYIQKEHERLAVLAEQKDDLATATRNKELVGKTIGAYKERQETDLLVQSVPVFRTVGDELAYIERRKAFLKELAEAGTAIAE